MREHLAQIGFGGGGEHAQVGKVAKRELGLRRGENVAFEDFGGGGGGVEHQVGKSAREQVDFAFHVVLVVAVKAHQPDVGKWGFGRQGGGDLVFRLPQELGEGFAAGVVV